MAHRVMLLFYSYKDQTLNEMTEDLRKVSKVDEVDVVETRYKSLLGPLFSWV